MRTFEYFRIYIGEPDYLACPYKRRSRGDLLANILHFVEDAAHFTTYQAFDIDFSRMVVLRLAEFTTRPALHY